MAKKSRAPKSSVVPLSVARRAASAQQRNNDRTLAQRHQAALRAIDNIDRGKIIRDFVSSRPPAENARPMATYDPEPECQPMASRQPSGRIPLAGLALFVVAFYAAVGGAIWLIVR